MERHRTSVRRAGANSRWMAMTGLGVVVALLASWGAPVAAQGRSRADLVEKLKGKRVRKDASTGQLREMTSEEAASFVDTVARMTDRAALEARLAGGASSRVVAVGEHFGHVTVARPNPDGTTSVRCVASADEAVDFLAGDAPDVQ